jgi:hypothetical protein
MSLDNKLWWECERKSVYPSENAARRAAERIRAQPRYPKNKYMIHFKCKHADHWHVGHANPESRTYKEFKEREKAQE